MIGDEFVVDFVIETRQLVEEMQELLEQAENGQDHAKCLEQYGQVVDRIMGGAKSLAMNMTGSSAAVTMIADYSAVCKAVGYKASQIKDNPNFLNICVALLMDATEVLGDMLVVVEKGQELDMRSMVSQTLIDRVKWASSKFSAEYRETVSVKKEQSAVKMSQVDIDGLMAKLGLG